MSLGVVRGGVSWSSLSGIGCVPGGGSPRSGSGDTMVSLGVVCGVVSWSSLWRRVCVSGGGRGSGWRSTPCLLGVVVFPSSCVESIVSAVTGRTGCPLAYVLFNRCKISWSSVLTLSVVCSGLRGSECWSMPCDFPSEGHARPYAYPYLDAQGQRILGFWTQKFCPTYDLHLT